MLNFPLLLLLILIIMIVIIRIVIIMIAMMMTEMQKVASMASALVLFFPLAVLFFGLCTAVLTFGQCMHKISTASMFGSEQKTLKVCHITVL